MAHPARMAVQEVKVIYAYINKNDRDGEMSANRLKTRAVAVPDPK